MQDNQALEVKSKSQIKNSHRLETSSENQIKYLDRSQNSMDQSLARDRQTTDKTFMQIWEIWSRSDLEQWIIYMQICFFTF